MALLYLGAKWRMRSMVWIIMHLWYFLQKITRKITLYGIISCQCIALGISSLFDCLSTFQCDRNLR